MKPLKISGFIVVILGIVLLIPFLFPQSRVSVFNYTIRIPTKFWGKTLNQAQYKDISSIKVLLEDSLTAIIDSTAQETPAIDTSKRNTNEPVLSVFKKDSIRSIIQPLEYPQGMDTLLYPFFYSLNKIQQRKELIRVLHYGDSQIEADRITSYFRNQMQKQFGGGGVGLIPITPLNPASISYVYETSGNMRRYTILNTKKSENEPQYGVLGNFSRFTDFQLVNETESEAWIFLKHPNTGLSKASRFNRCKLIISGNRSPLFIELKKNQTTLDADIYPSSNKLRVIDWEVERGQRDLTINLKGKDSPNLFAISFDTEQGIAVDNIPLRGSSGLEFSRLYKYPYHQILNTLNVKLIILQFGVNAVINMSRNVSRYEKAFLKQLTALRESHPEIPVVVIGVSDISEKTDEGYNTNAAVEKIRDAQRRAAFTAGCVFWDMYEGMGGKNSMPSWVLADPPLAQKDFMHLNPLGAKIIGEMFYRSLMNEYNKYNQK